MVHYLITFRSVTPAQRGERALRRAGIACSIQRTPKWMEQQGCGYSLLVQQPIGPALGILQKNGVDFRKVYLRGEDGITEEVQI